MQKACSYLGRESVAVDARDRRQQLASVEKERQLPRRELVLAAAPQQLRFVRRVLEPASHTVSAHRPRRRQRQA
eukprot:1974737-Rhodomonas_salina.3